MNDWLDLAWEVINHWVENDYDNSLEKAADEMGDLNDLAIQIVSILEGGDFTMDDKDDMTWLSSQIEEQLF